jgi:hypothetical protein
MNRIARLAIKNGLRTLESDLATLPASDDRRDEYTEAAESLREILGEPNQASERAAALELYITTSDKRTLDAADFAFRHVSQAVDLAARVLAKARADWHDDPEHDPEGYAEHHAPAFEQFDDEARAAVVVALFERCERIRRENLLNAQVNP